MSSSETHAKVIIVGAGFSGLGLAIQLKQRGSQDFLVLERAEDVGGTWTANTYPGCTCDIPSHLYSFSFAPNPNWSATYSPQPEIRDYLRRCADRYAVRGHVRTGVAVESATWREETQVWELQTSAGSYTADVLVSAMGPLTEPKLPDVAGLADFEGKVMHSARWDHEYDLHGKRVASIGTGASAIQYVPEIAPVVEELYVFQRTAPWIMPHGNRPLTSFEQRLYRRLPRAQRIVRSAVYASRELLVLGFAKQPKLMKLLERLSRSHMRRQITDEQLRERVTPDYTLGCKRIIPSNSWYPTLTRPNVELVASGLREVRARSVVDSEGVERDVDAIVLGTGYHVTDMPAAYQVRGRDGVLLDEAWQGSPRAYLGTAVPGFPNFFMLLGPNTGLGHGSMVYMIEAQIAHLSNAIGAIEDAGASVIEVRREANEAFNREVDEHMRGTVWDLGGCSSFYLDRTGRNATLWPDWTWRFRRLAADPDLSAYRLSSGKPAVTHA
ncbi:MAG: NAD(P)/FAD-dependent oxidoreductase [Solirubrobacterales bacterium]|nr:NAD(P)/FAD-dependent oxidoreductase [Solirubrobacterales bacterium]